MKHHKGFTLIELLVVVAIIGILATIVITAVTSARDKTQNTKTAVQLKEIEKSLFAATLEENRETYWTGSELGGLSTDYFYLDDLLAIEYPNPGWAIKNYLNQAQTRTGGSTAGRIRYRNSESSINSCGAGNAVSLRLPSYSLEQRLNLNKIIDGEESTENPASAGGVECGKFSPRVSNEGDTYSLYRLSRNVTTIEF